MSRLRVLLLSPTVDATDVSESYVAFKWAEALSRCVDLTVLTMQRQGRPLVAKQLPEAEVVTWPEPAWLLRAERFNAMLKPAYPLYAARVRRWINRELARGRKIDLAHQVMPQAPRYASPLRHFDLPYVIGPLGGSLTTPEGFETEAGTSPWYTRLRRLDRFRLSHDPWLRRSYAQADLILGVAPYMRNLLQDIPLRRFEQVLELGVDSVPPPIDRGGTDERIRLLHVGRGVRTKGLRDVVRALAQLRDLEGVTLISAGAGEEIEICRHEAQALGVADRVVFRGQLSRSEVEMLYRTSDIFVFPSFRESAGNVIYEAMRWGLPVVTARRGGPDWIVDDSCGLKVDVTTPNTFAADLAAAIRVLATDSALRSRLGSAAREKIVREGLWQNKAKAMIALYEGVARAERVKT